MGNSVAKTEKELLVSADSMTARGAVAERASKLDAQTSRTQSNRAFAEAAAVFGRDGKILDMAIDVSGVKRVERESARLILDF